MFDGGEVRLQLVDDTHLDRLRGSCWNSWPAGAAIKQVCLNRSSLEARGPSLVRSKTWRTWVLVGCVEGA